MLALNRLAGVGPNFLGLGSTPAVSCAVKSAYLARSYATYGNNNKNNKGSRNIKSNNKSNKSSKNAENKYNTRNKEELKNVVNNVRENKPKVSLTIEEQLKNINFNSLEIITENTHLTELENLDNLNEKRKLLSKEHVRIKKHKPTNPGIRWFRRPIHEHLHKGKPIRHLTIPKKQWGGRNNSGQITVRHRGGGHRRRIRIIDYNRWESGKQTVVRIEYDPNRSAHIALLKHNKTEELSYIIAGEGLRAGDTVESFRKGFDKDVDASLLASTICAKGNCLKLSMIPVGTIINNIGILENGPARFCRGAGTFGRLMQKIPEKNRAIVKLKSGELRYVSLEAIATIGVVSNASHQLEMWGKAGRARRRGIRPTVRGVAMNKRDHPHGGGRGKSKSNKLSMSPWGQLAKGYKTRRGKHVNKMKVKDRPRGNQQLRA
ncbi:mitochondrial 54S ribosomal protein uL2m [Ascoidea rubescens DSM 1968]|uniref:Large ribosomal subunit protein uL2m n=1 Tax=Ascoidea rubescens DSM 1968 TaxID=1344418 RepID=A0A1D2VCF1_9ASCO|nr:ribosomal protein L2 [Ascoidea rubescens DSM 1968]ODV59306.1 ribosomal protein L2 [Ascoidea rubescens DSM 1968]